MALTATIYLSLLGKNGFRQMALLNYHNAHYLAKRLEEVLGLVRHHNGPFFNEFTVRLPKDPAPALSAMQDSGILAGSILVFVLTISALVVPRMLGGPTYTVMATLIYDEFMQLLDWPSGSALAFALTFITIAVIWISDRLTRRWAGAA